jgi:hypothetical protein
MLMQRFALVKARSERDSMALLLRMRQQAHEAPAAPPAVARLASPRPRQAAVSTGRLLGRLVAKLLRLLRLR